MPPRALRENHAAWALTTKMKKESGTLSETKPPANWGVDAAPGVRAVKVSKPPVRSAGVKVADVDELVAKLKALGVHS